MTKKVYNSGRVQKLPQSEITSDRYEFLGLNQAEPDLGDPVVGVSSIGVKPYSGSLSDFYVLGVDPTETGSRYWIPKSTVIAGGVQNPGNVTIRERGVIVGTANSISQINFIGAGVEINTPGSYENAEDNTSVDIEIVSVAAAASATNVQGGVRGNILYQIDTNDTEFLSNGENRQVLSFNTSTNLPQWSNLENLSAANVNIEADTENVLQYLLYTSPDSVSVGTTNTLKITSTGLVFNPSTNNLGVGVADPQATLSLDGTIAFSDTNVKIGGTSTGQNLASDGENNVFVGVDAGNQTTNGDYNTFYGNRAGYSNQGGSGNVYLGYNAGNNLQGDENVVIGYNVTAPLQLGSRQLVIGDSTGNWINGDINHNVGFGTTAPRAKVDIVGNVNITGVSTLNDLRMNRFSPDGSDYGGLGDIPIANADGTWTWKNFTEATSGEGFIKGITLSDNGDIVTDPLGTVKIVDFSSGNFSVSAAGTIGTVTYTANPSYTTVNVGVNSEVKISANEIIVGLTSQVGIRTTGITVSGIVSATSLTVTQDTVIRGNLTVEGTTTTIDTQNLIVEDKNIGIGSVANASDTTADGGGITLFGTTNHTITWTNSTDSWNFSDNVNVVSGKEYRIAGTTILNATTLGSSVINSSLTSVGTISAGTWQGTAINDDYIGTINNDNKVSLSALDIDGGISTSTVADADLFVIDRGGNGTNRKIQAQDLKSYFTSGSLNLDGNLDLNGNNIIGSGNINITGIITATSVYATNLYGNLTGTATTASNLTRNVFGGNGLTNNLNVTQLTSDVTLSVGVGTGIAVGADSVSLKNSGSLTGNKVLKWNSTNGQLTDSNITDTGTLVTIGSTIKIGNLQDSANSTGEQNYVPIADGSGGWIWKSITSGTGAISGITVKDETTTIGSGSDINDIRFVGNNVTVTSGGTGIATVTISDVSAGEGITVTGGNTVSLKNSTNLENNKFLKWDDANSQLISADVVISNVGTATTAEQLTKNVFGGSGLSNLLNKTELTEDITLNVGAGIGISVSTDSVSLKNSGSLTGNKVLKWNSTNGQLTDSNIEDDGTLVTIGSTIKIGNLQDSSGTLPSTSNYVPLSDGNGGWSWGPLAGATPNLGITVRDETTSIGSSITDLRFIGNIVTVTSGGSGIASVTFADNVSTATTASNVTRNVYGGNGLTNDLNVSQLTSDVTLSVGVGTGIAVGSDSISLKNSAAFTNVKVLKWDDSNGQFVDSNITDSGTLVTIASSIKLANGSFVDAADSYGQANEVPVADGSGGWAWGPGGGGGAGSIGGITVKDVKEVITTIGTAGSITEIRFQGDNIQATSGGTGIAIVTVSSPTSVASATTASNLTRSVVAGDGLTGGGELTADRTLDVGAGVGITVGVDDVALKNSGSLTGNRVLKWDSGNGQLTNSNIADTASLVTVGVALTVSGNLSVSGIATAQTFDVNSDVRLKENIQIVDNPLDKVLRIEGVSFDWKKDKKRSIGVIAQNIEEVLPELVSGDDVKSVNYDGLIGVLIEAIKELNKKIDELS